jgi:hypothetical protein
MLSGSAFRRAAVRQGVKLDLKTRFLYSAAKFFMNGSDFPDGAVATRLFRRLADTRKLSAEKVGKSQCQSFYAALYRAYGRGFLHLA